MAVKVKYKDGYIGTVSEAVAEKLEKKGQAEIVDIAETAAPEAGSGANPAGARKRGGRS